MLEDIAKLARVESRKTKKSLQEIETRDMATNDLKGMVGRKTKKSLQEIET